MKKKEVACWTLRSPRRERCCLGKPLIQIPSQQLSRVQSVLSQKISQKRQPPPPAAFMSDDEAQAAFREVVQRESVECDVCSARGWTASARSVGAASRQMTRASCGHAACAACLEAWREEAALRQGICDQNALPRRSVRDSFVAVTSCGSSPRGAVASTFRCPCVARGCTGTFPSTRPRSIAAALARKRRLAAAIANALLEPIV